MKIKNVITSMALSLMASVSNAWWEAGHMAVADIAYHNLSTKAKLEVNKLLPLMAAENTKSHKYDYNKSRPHYTFMAISHWADDLKGYPNYLGTLTTWHYVEKGYTTDDTPMPEVVPRDNIISAIEGLTRSLKSSNGNANLRARSLSLLVHFVGDIHQPLHATELYSQRFLHNDRGGNLYDIRYTEEGGYELRNLHKLWDSAINLFPRYGYKYNVSDKASIDAISRTIMDNVPISSVANRAYDLSVTNWCDESHELGILAHDTPLGEEPTDGYIEKNTDVVEMQLAIAGYRLAGLLNSIFK